MKIALRLAVAALCLAFVSKTLADEKNGVRVTVQKTTFDKTVDRDPGYWDKVDKALGLKIDIQNIAMKDLPVGELTWTVVVKRWGFTPPKYERYEGKNPLSALKPGGQEQLRTGKVRLGGWQEMNDRKAYVDSIEAWQVILTHAGAETIKLTSSQSFEKLKDRAEAGHQP